MDELVYASATHVARAIRAKQVSSVEVVGAYLRRIEAVNPALNAVVQLLAETALSQARQADAGLAKGETTGPLHGVPFTIKDSFETAGVISTAGTKGRDKFIPKQDATAVARFRAAGGIPLGKTNLPELSLALESDNLIYGRTNNPYDLTRTPGGSSGGESAIIAAGGSPLGLGTDAGGSIRIPAHFCGIAGLKPTSGRVPFTGLFPAAFGASARVRHVGPMARFVEDLILTLPILSGMDWQDQGTVPVPLGDPRLVDLKSLRVAFYTESKTLSPTPETATVVKEAVKHLAEAGLAVEEALPPGVDQAYELWMRLYGAEGGAGVQRTLQTVGTTEPHLFTKKMVEKLKPYAMTTAEFTGFLTQWDLYRSTMLQFMKRYDVLISPVSPFPAPPHGATLDEDKFPGFGYTMAYNLTGWPGATVRGGTSPEGLPVGVQIVAQPWREDVALAVAQYLETALGGWQRPPL